MDKEPNKNKATPNTSAIDDLPQSSSIAYFKASKKHSKVPNASVLKTAKIFWPISLFMQYHEKEDFAAMVDFVVGPRSVLKAGNQEFILMDGPEAYNFGINKFGIDPEGLELRDAADQAGDKWLRDNLQAVRMIRQNNVKFSRWREILIDPDYQAKRKEIFDCYNSTSTDFTVQRVKAAMDHTAFAVLDVFKERSEINDVGRGREMAVRSVLEKSAVFAHMALKYRFHFIACPSDCPEAVAITKEIFVDSDPRARGKNLLQWLKVGFRHPKPQHSNIAPEPEISEVLTTSLQQKSNSSRGDSQRKLNGDVPGTNKSSSSNDEVELSPALKLYQNLLISQITSFIQTLIETGELNKKSSRTLLRSIAKSLISGSQSSEYSKPHPKGFAPSIKQTRASPEL